LAQQGDRAAFTTLAASMESRLHGVAYGILRDMHLAQDAVQVALLEAWRDLPQLRDPQAFEAWIYRMLVRSCRRESKRAERWLPAGAVQAREPVAPDGVDLVVDRDQLERAFRRLSVEERTVIVLYHYLDLPHDRVAATLGVPAGTARSRLSRAMRSLRASIEADGRTPAPSPMEVAR
jgi:RNA polymerase sigma-70 factor (ECF subfamily)